METEGKTKKESNKALWITGIILVIFLIAIITNGFGIFDNKNSKTVNITIGNSPVLGNPDSKITIYIFSDFSCPFCQVLATQTMPLVVKNYVNTGKAKIVFKYYPTHSQAEAAHKVAFCLNQQNLFWRFHDTAFANPINLNNIDKMKSLALTIGADKEKLNSCLNSTDFNAEFQKDISLAKLNALQGTPTIIINDRLYSGALFYQEIKTILDKLV
jgi:protein-disulfide isomerase